MKVWGHDPQIENHCLREFQFPVHFGILKKQGNASEGMIPVDEVAGKNGGRQNTQAFFLLPWPLTWLVARRCDLVGVF